MQPGLNAAHGALKLAFFVSSLTVASLGAHLASANISPEGEANARAQAIARLTHSDFSDHALLAAYGPAPASVFARFDPRAKGDAATSLLHLYEGPLPQAHLSDLTNSEAQLVNSGVPISAAPNPAARPFALTGTAGDKDRALTCLTQAVYYEAALEPRPGQEAVAQVVLNRVRHPIFPRSVCGVVYQGASQKTGCQFSFTCDGSLGRPPVKWAWDNARAVASRALGGYVAKDVGEATHYHTQWIVPWWSPSVTKVAHIGAHIFYRWPGTLGMPVAFVGRYSGVERIEATAGDPNAQELAERTGTAQPRSEVSAKTLIAINQTDGLTPHQRLQALAAKGALGDSFQPSSVITAQPAKLETAAPVVVSEIKGADVKLAPIKAPMSAAAASSLYSTASGSCGTAFCGH